MGEGEKGEREKEEGIERQLYNKHQHVQNGKGGWLVG